MATSQKKNDDKQSVVVVGGGSAGVNIARALSAKLDSSKFELVLINPRPYRIILPAALRMVVSDVDNLDTTALVPYDKLFLKNNGTFLQDEVELIQQERAGSGGMLVCKSGNRVPYDVLVLATGMNWTDPIAFPDTAADVRAYIDAARAKFSTANSYLIVGGGAVGCELAGELKDAWPTKDVALVHSQRLLLNDTYPDKYRERVARELEARAVKIHLGDVVPVTANSESDKVVSDNGQTFQVDMVIRTAGAAHPNTGFINSLGGDVLTSRGFVKVRPTLQTVDFPNIFAAGDIIEWKEEKQAVKCMAQAPVVANNVLSYLPQGMPLKKTYSTSFEGVVLTNGKFGGVSYFDVLWGITIGSWLTSLLKSKSLLVPLLRKESGM